jgi:hypothetical protein
MWKRKKAHPRAEMLKDGPLLSLKLEYLSKFQSSFNQVLIKLQIKNPPICIPVYPARCVGIRSDQGILCCRGGQMKKIKNGAAQTGRTALYKGQSLSSRFILAQFRRLVKRGRNRAARI